MDVLELPRPVINFLRTMSKEMHRYSLCWDIYGGSENVTLTLTWKLSCEDSSDSGEAKPETKSPKHSRKAKKKNRQYQHFRLDTLKTCSRILTDKRNAQSDFKQQCNNLSPCHSSKEKLHEPRRYLDASISPVFSSSLNTPTKYSHKNWEKRPPRGKSLESYENKEAIYENNKQNSINRNTFSVFKNTSDWDPWIRRDSFDKNVNKSDIEKEDKLLSLIENIAGEKDAVESKSHATFVANSASPCFKTNSGNQTNTGLTFSSSSKTTNGPINNSSIISKVSFDPNLEFI